MGCTFNEGIIQPCLRSSDSIISEVNKEFIDFTRFSIDELTGKSLVEIGEMLRINSQIHLSNINNKYSAYIFTKSLEAREVDIVISHVPDTNEKVYSFIEKFKSRLDDKLAFVEQTFNDNIIGSAVFSVPDLIMLRANQLYLDFMDSPFNIEGNSIGKPIREIVTGYVGSEAEDNWRNVLESQKTSYIKEFRCDNFQRGVTYWNSTQTPIFENGKMRYIYETSTEITEMVLGRINNQKEQLRKKQQLLQRNTQLSNIIENLSDGIIIADNKGKYMLTNSEARRLLYKPDELNALGQVPNNSKYFDMQGKEIPHNNMPGIRALKGERVKNCKIFIRSLDKEFFMDASAIPIYDDNNDLTMIVSSFHDITDTIEQSKKIQEQKEQLEAIIENMPDALAFYNKEGQVILLNAEARKLHPKIDTGKSVAEVHDGYQYFDLDNNILLPENLPTRRVFRGERARNERIILKQSDIIKIIEINATPVFNKRHNLVSAVVSHRDITEMVRNEQEIKAQQEKLVIAERDKNEALEKVIQMQEEFFANISHELKTPLNVIFATSQLLNMYCNDGSFYSKKDSVVKYIESIKQNSYRLSKLINNIVDLSKIEAGFFDINLSNNNVVDVVEEIVMSITNYTRIKGLNIVFDTDTEEKIIACDPEKIERIVLNLISNAIKFSDEGDEIFVSIKNKCEFVEISVKDNGIGIEDKYLAMIFDRFKQVDKSLSRNAEGTGIGLSIVKSIVELHGGSIYVESELGNGSRFTVVLPTKRVIHENMLQNNKMENKAESIQIELSDIC
ncbi:PAS domain S-box protein [Clostridium bowmanii]|uniref:PAS domain-containing sensor histidine kinase n=1 Tax=Clostridium bowmanii TaxID=132925 RepID=UPI001C0AE9C0|nr:ATP-binding protein [Clostridium bowmanii]MBU3189485.1 PAS domain S-box protein [Clostridium bowmanii]MCA1074099.1 PAS domain S-box protein [Clostridium bowmanii]